MKAKKLISGLCTLAMVLSLFAPGGLVTTAQAVEGEQTGHVHSCTHGHDPIEGEWIALSSTLSPANASGNLSELGAGNYYLDEDYNDVYAFRLVGDGDINLCLNGHTLSGENITGQKYIFRTYDAATVALNICDCSAGQTGKITGLNETADSNATTSAVFVSRASGSVNLYGGTVTGNTAAAVVGCVSTFNMYGGSITDNDVRNAVIFTFGDASAAAMSGGSITGNTVTHASHGAVHVDKGSFTMTGGEISDNEVAGASQVTKGSNGAFNQTGGTVTEYVAPPHVHSCTHGHETFTGEWIPLSSMLASSYSANATVTLKDANYYVDKDIALSKYVYFVVQGNVRLCLNGNNLTGAGRGYILHLNASNTTLDLCDCAGGGTLGDGWTAAATNGNTYSVIRVGSASNTNVEFNMYNGSITGATAGSIIYVEKSTASGGNGATFNMYGGSITGNVAKYSAAVVVGGAPAMFNMYGGEISGNETASDSYKQVYTFNQTNNTNYVGGTIEGIFPETPAHTHTCTHTHTVTDGEWIPFSSVWKGDAIRTPIPGGRYYLDEDITLNSGADATKTAGDINFTGDSVFCLNGHTLNGGNVANMFRTEGTVTVDICDCAGTGTVTGHRNTGTTQSVIIARNGGTVNICGGTFTGNSGRSLIYVADGNVTVNIEGGTFESNTAETDVYLVWDDNPNGTPVSGTAKVTLYGTETFTASTEKHLWYYFNPTDVAGQYTLKTSRYCAHTELTHVPAAGKTCEQDGNIEYWSCSCGKYFSDAAAVSEITDKTTVVIPAAHDIIDHDGQAAAPGIAGWNAYQTCSRCDYSTYTEIPALEIGADQTVKVETFKEAGKTPVSEEGFFAGYYADADHSIAYTADSGDAYVKFVARDVLSVKGQLAVGTTAQSEKTDLRLLTTVDDLNYRQIGFKITVGGRTVTVSSNKVFERIVANEGGVAYDKTPSVFHEQSGYFMTYTITDIPADVFGTTITVVPYWVTLDGTEQEGRALTFTIAEVINGEF